MDSPSEKIVLSKFDKISASKLNLAYECPRKFFLKYKLKIREPETIHMERGTFAHTCLELFFEPKKVPFRGGDGEFYEQFEGRLDEIFDIELKKTKMLILEPDMIQETRDGLHFYLGSKLREFEKLYKKRGAYVAWACIRPNFRELEMETEWAMGYCDFVQEDPATGEIIVGDYKTSGIYKNTYKKEYVTQILFYAYMYQEMRGVLPHVGLIEFLLYCRTHQVDITQEAVEKLKVDVMKLIHYRHANWGIDDIEKWPKAGQKDFDNPDGADWCKTCPMKTMINPATNQVYCDGIITDTFVSPIFG